MMTMTAAEVRRRTGTSTVVPAEAIENARYKQHTHTHSIISLFPHIHIPMYPHVNFEVDTGTQSFSNLEG